MKRLSQLVGLLSLVFGFGLLAGETAVAQSSYAGTWVLVPNSTVGHIPGLPPPPVLEIEISGELTATKGQLPPETYRTDGTETELPEYRKGKLTINDGTMNLTTTRVRPNSETVTIVNDLYAVKGNDLRVTRTLRVERPKGDLIETPQNRWDARYTRQPR